jgi:fumarate hydratase class I
VYLHAVGGAATYIANSVKEVLTVYKEDLGHPEAFWVIRVDGFPAVVTMDTRGNSLHVDVRRRSEDAFVELLGL